MAAAADGLFPQVFGRLSKRGVPAIGTVISAGLATALLLWFGGGRVVQDPLLQPRHGAAAEVLDRPLQAPLEGRHRVSAEVVVVLQVHRVKQQLGLDVEVPGRTRRLTVHLGIHTRTSDSNCSTSSGFAM